MEDRGTNGCNATHQCDTCQGDCDDDRDCVSGLKCFQRESNTKIPECTTNSNDVSSNTDVCISAIVCMPVCMYHARCTPYYRRLCWNECWVVSQ